MLTSNYLEGSSTPLPVIISDKKTTIQRFVEDNIDGIQELYEIHGFILFRNFLDTGFEYLNSLSDLLFKETMEQPGRHTGRRKVDGSIHTSTEAHRSAVIVQHSENSYLERFPTSILFKSIIVAETGGRTPIACLSTVAGKIPEGIKDKVRKHGIQYVRRMGLIPGRGWQDVYNTNDPIKLTEQLERDGVVVAWNDDLLTTIRTLPGFFTQNEGEEPVWFNALYSSNSRTLPEVQRKMLIKSFGEGNLPSDTFFGNGEPLTLQEFGHLEAAYNSSTFPIQWMPNDLVWIDNLRFSHGRESYTGDRQLLVVLGNPATWVGPR